YGAVDYEDAWRSRRRLGDWAGDAHVLIFVGVDGFLRPTLLRAKGHEVENWIRFGLVDVEHHELPTALQAILGHLGVDHFPTYGCGFAEVVLCIGSGQDRWFLFLSESQRQQGYHAHRN